MLTVENVVIKSAETRSLERLVPRCNNVRGPVLARELVVCLPPPRKQGRDHLAWFSSEDRLVAMNQVVRRRGGHQQMPLEDDKIVILGWKTPVGWILISSVSKATISLHAASP